ncbi:MAG: hypothetical protein AAGF54_17320 [Pseudomonadota bacterium]
MALTPERVFAQTEPVLQSIYLQFRLGIDTVAGDVPVLLLAASIAHLLAIRKEVKIEKLWPFFMIGLGLGGVLGASALIPAVFPALVASILVGSLAAISIQMNFIKIAISVTLVTIVMANASLSGYSWQHIHSATYLGFFCGMILATMIVYIPIRVSLVAFHYSWVSIAWRATSSWLVAIAILLIALRFAHPPSEMQNWFERWANP